MPGTESPPPHTPLNWFSLRVLVHGEHVKRLKVSGIWNSYSEPS